MVIKIIGGLLFAWGVLMTVLSILTIIFNILTPQASFRFGEFAFLAVGIAASYFGQRLFKRPNKARIAFESNGDSPSEMRETVAVPEVIASSTPDTSASPPIIQLEGAGFGVRFLAQVIDTVIHYAATLGASFVIVILATIAVLIIGGSSETLSENLKSTSILGYVLAGLAYVVYHTVCEGLHGATLGKLICGITVVNENGTYCNMKSAFLRSLAFYVDGIFFGIVAYSSMSSSTKRQRLGDKWGHTMVAKRRDLQPALRRSGARFFLVFLLAFLLDGITFGVSFLPVIAQALPPAVMSLPAPSIEPGWILYKKPSQGYAIALPPMWKEFDLDSQTVNEDLRAIRAKYPMHNVLPSEQVPQMLSLGIQVYAFDTQSDTQSTGYTTNLVVTKQSAGSATSLGILVLSVADSLQKDNDIVKPISQRPVVLAVGNAEKFQYTRNFIAGTGRYSVVVTQYVFAHGKDVYSITLGASPKEVSAYNLTFEKIANSFQWLK